MSVRYTGTWVCGYDVMQARQHHTLTQYRSYSWDSGYAGGWCDRVKMAEQCVVICS
jgi:hypothetical protein